jgi:CheY-like chemotaxis protein
MSKIEAGRMMLNENDFDLFRLLEDIAGMFRLQAREKNVLFEVNYDAGIPGYLRADEMKLRQVLINLLNNALKFSDQGKVTLCVSSANYQENEQLFGSIMLYFEVEDTGPGIAPAEMETIFEAFEQAKAGRESGQGTGLGLALSRQFVRLLDGDMTVRNVGGEIGNGTVFAFTIRARPAEEHQSLPVKQTAQVLGLKVGQPDFRILVVDDDRQNRELLGKILRPIGFLVEEAVNGREAIAIWDKWQPDVVCMDLHMPVMNGFQATQIIRSRPGGEDTIIIAITASTFAEEQPDVRESGWQALFHKPLNPADLLETLGHSLGVQYEYIISPTGDGQQPLSARTPEHLTPAHLNHLPAHLLDHLATAARQASLVHINNHLEEVRRQDPDLAHQLQKLADEFNYGKILALLE